MKKVHIATGIGIILGFFVAYLALGYITTIGSTQITPDMVKAAQSWGWWIVFLGTVTPLVDYIREKHTLTGWTGGVFTGLALGLSVALLSVGHVFP